MVVGRVLLTSGKGACVGVGELLTTCDGGGSTICASSIRHMGGGANNKVIVECNAGRDSGIGDEMPG